MAAAEPAPAPAKAAPNLGSLFPAKKKNFKGTNLSMGGQKEVKKKAASGTDEWGEEEVTNEKLRVNVQVEELNTNDNEVVEDKPTWKAAEKAKDEDAPEKTTKQYPSLARSVKPGAGASSAGPAAPAKVEGISGKASKFDALNEEEDEEEEKNVNTADDAEAAAKKAAKKEAKRLEKEKREKEASQAAATREKKERVVKVGGVEDTKIRPDMDAIQAKYDGRRKRPVVEIDED